MNEEDKKVFDAVASSLEGVMNSYPLDDPKTRKRFALSLLAIAVAACNEAGIPQQDQLEIVNMGSVQ